MGGHYFQYRAKNDLGNGGSLCYMDRFQIISLSTIVLSLVLSGCLGSGDDDGNDDTLLEVEKHLSSAVIPLDEGQTGSLDVPLVGLMFVDTDVKHHWDMPQNISGIRVNLTCSDPSWDVELAIGTGDCPHSGMAMNTTNGPSGELSIEYWVTGDDSLQTGQWFCHIASNDMTSHRGESLNYVFEATLFSYEEIDCHGDVCPV